VPEPFELRRGGDFTLEYAYTGGGGRIRLVR
jgi:hypothetical protein